MRSIGSCSSSLGRHCVPTLCMATLAELLRANSAVTGTKLLGVSHACMPIDDAARGFSSRGDTIGAACVAMLLWLRTWAKSCSKSASSGALSTPTAVNAKVETAGCSPLCCPLAEDPARVFFFFDTPLPLRGAGPAGPAGCRCCQSCARSFSASRNSSYVFHGPSRSITCPSRTITPFASIVAILSWRGRDAFRAKLVVSKLRLRWVPFFWRENAPRVSIGTKQSS